MDENDAFRKAASDLYRKFSEEAGPKRKIDLVTMARTSPLDEWRHHSGYEALRGSELVFGPGRDTKLFPRRETDGWALVGDDEYYMLPFTFSIGDTDAEKIRKLIEEGVRADLLPDLQDSILLHVRKDLPPTMEAMITAVQRSARDLLIIVFNKKTEETVFSLLFNYASYSKGNEGLHKAIETAVLEALDDFRRDKNERLL